MAAAAILEPITSPRVVVVGDASADAALCKFASKLDFRFAVAQSLTNKVVNNRKMSSSGSVGGGASTPPTPSVDGAELGNIETLKIHENKTATAITNGNVGSQPIPFEQLAGPFGIGSPFQTPQSPVVADVAAQLIVAPSRRGSDEDDEADEALAMDFAYEELSTEIGRMTLANQPKPIPGTTLNATVEQGGECEHKEHWKHLRSRRGCAYFMCFFCGAKWRIRYAIPVKKANNPNNNKHPSNTLPNTDCARSMTFPNLRSFLPPGAAAATPQTPAGTSYSAPILMAGHQLAQQANFGIDQIYSNSAPISPFGSSPLGSPNPLTMDMPNTLSYPPRLAALPSFNPASALKVQQNRPFVTAAPPTTDMKPVWGNKVMFFV